MAPADAGNPGRARTARSSRRTRWRAEDGGSLLGPRRSPCAMASGVQRERPGSGRSPGSTEVEGAPASAGPVLQGHSLLLYLTELRGREWPRRDSNPRLPDYELDFQSSRLATAQADPRTDALDGRRREIPPGPCDATARDGGASGESNPRCSWQDSNLHRLSTPFLRRAAMPFAYTSDRKRPGLASRGRTFREVPVPRRRFHATSSEPSLLQYGSQTSGISERVTRSTGATGRLDGLNGFRRSVMPASAGVRLPLWSLHA